MRVIVTGSRDWDDPAAVHAALDALLATRPNLTVVHGDCPTGADHHADTWARLRGVTTFVYRADWKLQGRGAGPVRNRRMVAAGADLVLAFCQPGAANRGTADCVRRAQAAGIPIRRYPEETDHA